MKTTFFVLLVYAMSATMFAQTDTVVTQKRKAELSFSASLQNFAFGGGKSSTTLLFAPRVGFFVHEGLQIEPEGVILLSSGNPAYMLNANLVYNFLGNGKSIPFLLAGYGIANSVPIYSIPAYFQNVTIGVLNLGVGIKSFIVENIALRGEYRFQKFTGGGRTDSIYGYSYTQNVDARIHSVQFGIVIVP